MISTILLVEESLFATIAVSGDFFSHLAVVGVASGRGVHVLDVLN